MSVGEAEVPPALIAAQLHHLLLLALLDRAPLVEDLPPLPGRVGLAVGIDVGRHGHVRHVTLPPDGDGAVAQWADRHAGVGGDRAGVGGGREVIPAEDGGAAGALDGEEVQALAGRQGAVRAQVGKLHGALVVGGGGRGRGDKLEIGWIKVGN